MPSSQLAVSLIRSLMMNAQQLTMNIWTSWDKKYEKFSKQAMLLTADSPGHHSTDNKYKKHGELKFCISK